MNEKLNYWNSFSSLQSNFFFFLLQFVVIVFFGLLLYFIDVYVSAREELSERRLHQERLDALKGELIAYVTVDELNFCYSCSYRCLIFLLFICLFVLFKKKTSSRAR